ncbi:MAG: DUF4249 domain-containing protein [Bacteroidales bacterium]|nr:MAG: DUF4249 domain-containing protein [Bacteroidales bacterium]
MRVNINISDNKLRFTVLRLFLYLLVAFTCQYCEKEVNIDLPQSDSKIVVEGWIEHDRYPHVILTRSAPYFASIDSASLRDYVVTTAKVTIITDDQSEVLTLKPNDAYFPPYVYFGTELKGEIHRTYNLRVEFGNVENNLSASTYIPTLTEPDSVWFELEPESDSLGRIWISLSDNPGQTNYYRLLTKRKGKDKRYVANFKSAFSDKLFNGETIVLGFTRGLADLLDLTRDNLFTLGDTISVKFCSIDREHYEFWNTYQNEILLSANPFSASNAMIKSNINNGLGVWGGYAASYYIVIAK